MTREDALGMFSLFMAWVLVFALVTLTFSPGLDQRLVVTAAAVGGVGLGLSVRSFCRWADGRPSA